MGRTGYLTEELGRLEPQLLDWNRVQGIRRAGRRIGLEDFLLLPEFLVFPLNGSESIPLLGLRAG